MTEPAADAGHMRHALALARRALGNAAPNPAVGCVLVREGRVIGRGHTRPGGRPHAEAVALGQATLRDRNAARGATAYVSLEPCSHHGATPPCADALIGAGVARVVSALEDPDPRVSGAGHARLAAAGIAVEQGLLAEEARQLNLGFILAVTEGRPLVAVKSAMSLDGRIAAGGDSRWITGPPARAAGHLARARYDANAVGLGTATADDPRLDCRLPGLGARAPLRVVFDSAAALDPRLDLAAAAGVRPTLLFCTEDAPAERVARLADLGVTVVRTAAEEGRVALPAALRLLTEGGITRLLVEGGGTLIAALLRANLVEVVLAHRAPILIGGDGVPAVGPLGLARVAEAPRFVAALSMRQGDDMVEYFLRRR